MRAVLQRVREAAVRVPAEPGGAGGPDRSAVEHEPLEREVARIGRGLLVFVGFSGGESGADLDWLAEKILGLRLFGPGGAFERSVVEVGGEVLVVSQFTLLAGVRKGRRPDFAGAAPSAAARPLYDGLLARLRERYPAVREGVFGAEMRVALVNDGPATFLLERGG